MINKKISGTQVLRKLIKYTWHASPTTFVLLVISSLFMSALGFLEIVSIKTLFDSAVDIADGAAVNLIYKPIIGLLAILVLYPFGEWLEYMANGYFWRRGSGYMKFLHHNRINHMKSIEFEDSTNIDELKKASLGSEDAPSGLRVIVQILFLYIPYILSLLLYLVNINPVLVLVIVLIFIPTFLLERIRVKQSFEFEDKMGNRRRKTEYFEKCMISKEYFKETLLNGSFKYFHRLFTESNKEFSKEFISTKRHILKSSVFMKLLNAVGFLSVLMLLVYFVYSGVISIGLFAAIYYSISKITTMLRRAIEDMGEALVGISNTSFLVRLLDDNCDLGMDADIPKDQDIQLRDVSFAYPNASGNALRNINLTIKAGTSLAIVGENGSGKSTLTKVIMGLYDPTKGQVVHGDKPLHPYSNASKFKGISAVFQDFVKYKLSVEDNVKMSNITCELETEDVLDKAEINLPELNIKGNTILSREFGGQDLSGGEWQRIAIARGLYRPHNLIVLDEPTAAIDPIEEANVFESFKRISALKTCVFVTHRLGSTKIADRIIVMDKGEIVEEGTHLELLNMQGRYYELLQSQAQWYER
ncbi:ABC transporter ATP-binding protein/permease [Clostridium sp. CS001]|uniref:ABC transporter ATP-binding protein n=1 Tax=Clostridium sp. CS001 TaxID=2880648 RepID=UPI001CF4AE97|nr:ABC transporter ATP-binding protein [Clostridium sp. CS001]MCB2288930.1 ABC transporter ATP-binding protein/permease [Clostridium sp. CS001]